MEKENILKSRKENARITIFVIFFMLLLCIIWWFYVGLSDFELTSTIRKYSISIRTTVICYTTVIWISYSIFNDYRKCYFSFYNGYKAFILHIWSYITCILYFLSLNSNILTSMIIVSIVYTLYYLQVEKLTPCEKIIQEEEDWLYRARLFNRTHLQIRKLAKESNKGLTIGICGQWGSGKTFFIDNLITKLSNNYENQQNSHHSYNDAFVICNKVDLWDTHSLNNAWERVINSLQTAILKRPPICTGLIKRIVHSILNFLNIDNKAVSEIVDLVLSNIQKTDGSTIKTAMQNKKYILVFDDLERTDFATIQAMLPLFERLKALPNLIVICAIAENELKQVFMQNKMDSDFAHGYLNKLFDLRIEIPTLSYSAIQNYQDKILSRKYSDCKLTRSFFNNYPLRFDNARQMLRVIEKLTNIERVYFSGCSQIFGDPQTPAYNTKVLTRVKFIFLVETLRITSPTILNLLSRTENILNFIQEIPINLLPHGYDFLKHGEDYDITYSHLALQISSTNKEDEKITIWISKNPEIYTEIISKKIARSVLTIIRYDKNIDYRDYSLVQDNFIYALNSNYTRFTTLQEWEMQHIHEKSDYAGLTYREKIARFFSNVKETIENHFFPDAILLLFKFELQQLKIKCHHLRGMCDSLEKEYQYKDSHLSLYNLNPLDMTEYTHFIYDILQQNKQQTDKNKDFTLLFRNLYKIMSLTQQSRVLYFYSTATSHNEEILHKLFKESLFKELVTSLTVEYGYNLAHQIYILPKEELDSNTLDAFPMQVYKFINDSSLVSSIKKGICSYITQFEEKELYLLEWIRFMGIQYRSPSIIGGINSSFTSKKVFEMMKMIKHQLQEILNHHDRIKKKSEIYKACEQTIIELGKDKQQWENVEEKDNDKDISGLDNLIAMIKEIRDVINIKD